MAIDKDCLIVDFCGTIEDGNICVKDWKTKVFAVIDFEKLALCSGREPIEIRDDDGKLVDKFRGVPLKRGDIAAAILDAAKEKEPARLKCLRNRALVTTEHILFQFYLIKRILASASA